MVFLIVARVVWKHATRATHGVLVKRLRHRPFTAVTWVQLPYTSPHTKGVRPGVAKTSRHGEMVLHLPSIRRLVRFRPRTSIMQHWCSGSTSAFQADGTGSIPVCCSISAQRGTRYMIGAFNRSRSGQIRCHSSAGRAVDL